MRTDMFMITCAARTGSTLLESFLRSHPDTMMHGEVYPPNHTAALNGRFSALIKDTEKNAALTAYRDKHQASFLYKYIYDSQGKAVTGHKLKHEELLLPKFAETREVIRRDTDIKIIHLYRRDLFRRFVSWWVVNHVTGVTMVTDKTQPPTIKPTVIPIAACVENFNTIAARYRFFSKFFRHHKVLDVIYEDLIGEQQEEILNGVAKFLGIKVFPFTTSLRKVTPNDVRKVVANYDEIASHFEKTEFAEFFNEASV